MIDARTMKLGTEAAYAEAQASFEQGGIPVGSALLLNGAVVAVGGILVVAARRTHAPRA